MVRDGHTVGLVDRAASGDDRAVRPAAITALEDDRVARGWPCRHSFGQCGADGWPIGNVTRVMLGNGGAVLDGRPAGAVAGASSGDGCLILTKERGRNAGALAPLSSSMPTRHAL